MGNKTLHPFESFECPRCKHSYFVKYSKIIDEIRYCNGCANKLIDAINKARGV